MAPPRPEAALPAIIAQVGAAAAELDHDGAFPTPITIAAVIDQFPPDAIGIQVRDYRGGWGRKRCARLVARSDAAHFGQGAPLIPRSNDVPYRLLSFALDDHIDPGFGGQDFAPVIRRMNAAISNSYFGKAPAHALRHLADDRLTRRGARMAEHHNIGSPRNNSLDQFE